MGISAYFFSWLQGGSFPSPTQQDETLNSDILASLSDFAKAYNKVVDKK